MTFGYRLEWRQQQQQKREKKISAVSSHGLPFRVIALPYMLNLNHIVPCTVFQRRNE